MEPNEILLKEYETLREEILTTMHNRNQILSFGILVMGAIFTTSLATYKENTIPVLSSIMLLLAVPAINVFVIFMWLGEYQRMQRAGKFIMGLEDRINNECKRKLLSWETNLRKQRHHMNYPYNMTLMLITIMSLISIVMGILMLNINVKYKIGIGIVGLFLNVIIFIYSGKKIRKLQV